MQATMQVGIDDEFRHTKKLVGLVSWGAGALLADTRTQGVVKGSGDPDARLDYVINEEQVHAGELVLTSGEDRIFPKDLLIGTVSMDLTTADVTGIASVKVGDIATIYGTDHGTTQSVPDVARIANTASADLLCALGKRVPRFYLP